VVWRCTNGAVSASLLTWGSRVLSNVAATAYAVVVVRDALFIVASLLKLLGCGAAALIAARRRARWRAVR
jgi:hypothetical protein